MPTLTEPIFRRTFAVLRKLNTNGGSSTQPVSSSSDVPEISSVSNSPIEKIKKFLKSFSKKFKFNLSEENCFKLSSDRIYRSNRSMLQMLRSDLKKGPVAWIDEIDSALASLLSAPQGMKEEEVKKAEGKASKIADCLKLLNQKLSALDTFKKVYRNKFDNDSVLSAKEINGFNEAVVKLIAEKRQPQIAISSSQSEEIQVQNANVLVFNEARKEINDLMKTEEGSGQIVKKGLTNILNYLETREVLFSQRILLCQLSGLSNKMCDNHYVGGRTDPLGSHGDIYPYYLRTLDTCLADFLKAVSLLLKKHSPLEAVEIINLVRNFEIKATVLNDLLSKRYYSARGGIVHLLASIAFLPTTIGVLLGLTIIGASITLAALGIIAASAAFLGILAGIAGGCLLLAGF